MRLICPNCGAQYEVADDVIPQDGRDVQCSNCGHTWFEHHGASDVEDAFTDQPLEQAQQAADEAVVPEPAPAPAPEPAPAPAADLQRTELDPAIADILREEAAREAQARSAEAANAIESQPDLGLDAAPAPVVNKQEEQSQRRIATMRGEATSDAVVANAGARREMLPDIEEINSSLRSEAERDAPQPALQAGTAKPKKRDFRIGFFTVMLLLAALLAIYIFADDIRALVPALSDLLDQYVAAVDQARIWLDMQMQKLLEMAKPEATETQ